MRRECRFGAVENGGIGSFSRSREKAGDEGDSRPTLTCSTRPALHAGAVARAQGMPCEFPAPPPTLSRKREREFRGVLW